MAAYLKERGENNGFHEDETRCTPFGSEVILTNFELNIKNINNE
jgi:hypothetical protein